MSDTQEQVTPPAPVAKVDYVPPSQLGAEALMRALQEDGVIPTPEAPPAQETAPVEEAPKEAAKIEVAPAKEELPALLRIAKERDAFRKEMESAKPHLEALKAIPSHTVSAIAKAIASGDPVSLLAAAGTCPGRDCPWGETRSHGRSSLEVCFETCSPAVPDRRRRRLGLCHEKIRRPRGRRRPMAPRP